ncbi:unnamed protein product [Prorocentrum cordatum]|uniref:Ribosome biogenesis protein NOP53 n=1 Tax=Prorocentrum cordatum TaxID=2364126 RepID=A0ABN9VHA2_9DINO|nr:unnamed protein product [Polarella glacialis]
MLRDQQRLKSGEITKRARALSGARPRPCTRPNYCRKVDAKKGLAASKFCRRGPQGPQKATMKAGRFLIAQLKKQRRASTCTSTSPQGLREKSALSTDGVVVPAPLAGPADRLNFLKRDEQRMRRTHSESFKPSWNGKNADHSRAPLSRAVSSRGGCSEGGFSTVATRARKELTGVE